MNLEAIAVAQKLDDPFSLVFAEHFLFSLHQRRGEVKAFRHAAGGIAGNPSPPIKSPR